MLTRLLILSTLFTRAIAGPMGASGCVGGQSAVGGPHLTKPLLKTGSLADGSLTFAINGMALDPDFPMDVPIGVTHTWTLSVDLEGLQARPFKGFLVRLDGSGVGVDDALLAISRQDGMVSQALACVPLDGVGGVTHVDNQEKTCVSGALILDEEMDGMSLDVTVVIENTGEKSAHFWSNFTLNAVESSDAMDMMDDLGCAAFSATSVPSMGASMMASSAETMAMT